ncbi:hypothetical protein FN976_16695 [Caenimonas sedimenti]|uniref:Glycosyltransferase RgtA/B/C/D-like domain-containing protein n=1 Tax=Caenimonas sedimenti TaxID=2596921 RepID=A0A562ZP96_9BURK|nr:glycosyltransferase family 39 protein [Caenimonas sedimenti]TWO69984.1 hypothetical protein FN976_16695 [Caenimonas sedimenti]
MNMGHANRWAAGALVLLLLLAAALRLESQRFDYGHPDEVISIKVAEQVAASGSLDTNWELADLPELFRKPQYNFSAYLLSGAAVLQLKEWSGDANGSTSLHWLRAWSALLGVATVGLTYLAGRQLFGAATGWCAALLVCFFPLLYQDSLYARPETFVSALTLACVSLLAPQRPPFRGGSLAAAFIAGVLIATKFSMVLLLPLLVLSPGLTGTRSLVSWDPPPARPWVNAWNQGKWLLLAVLLGFLAGAPHAIANAGAYLEGIQFLRRQYGTGHWPHGLVDADVVDRLAHAAGYFHATAGWLLPLAIAGALVAARRRQLRALFVFMVALATVVQFSVYPTFFERNLSHVIPLFMIFAAYGLVSLCSAVARRPLIRHGLTAVLLLMVMLPALQTTLTLRFDELPGEPAQRLAALRTSVERRFALPSLRVRWTEHEEDVREAMGHRCDGPMLVELLSAEDARSARLRQLLAERDGLREVARHSSMFSHVPPSTLHVYFTPTTVFLHRPPGAEACRQMAGGLVTAESVGDVLPLVQTTAESAWTPGGAALVTHDAHGSRDFHGSWSGSDALKGRLRMTVSVEGSRFLVLPYITGPRVHRQTIRISDAVTSKVILDSRPPFAPTWRFPFMRLPPGTRSVLIEAMDNGDGWGEWHAIGRPRALKAD